MFDDTAPESVVEVTVDYSAGGADGEKTLWVNVDGVCRYRCTLIAVPVIIKDNTTKA